MSPYGHGVITVTDLMVGSFDYIVGASRVPTKIIVIVLFGGGDAMELSLQIIQA